MRRLTAPLAFRVVSRKRAHRHVDPRKHRDTLLRVRAGLIARGTLNSQDSHKVAVERSQPFGYRPPCGPRSHEALPPVRRAQAEAEERHAAASGAISPAFQ